MQERSANSNHAEPGPPPERVPRVSLALTAGLAALWCFVVLTAPWIAPPVKRLANDLDLALGLWSKARPEPAAEEAP